MSDLAKMLMEYHTCGGMPGCTACNAEHNRELADRDRRLAEIASIASIIEESSIAIVLSKHHQLYACQACGEEFGDGEGDRNGRSPCCQAEGDPIGCAEGCTAHNSEPCDFQPPGRVDACVEWCKSHGRPSSECRIISIYQLAKGAKA